MAIDDKTSDAPRTATIESYVCDQGHYGISWCSHCDADLTPYVTGTKRFPKTREGIACPTCAYTLSYGEPTFNAGGSDY